MRGIQGVGREACHAAKYPESRAGLAKEKIKSGKKGGTLRLKPEFQGQKQGAKGFYNSERGDKEGIKKKRNSKRG